MPLWKAIFRSTLPAGLLNGILPLPLCHNGSKFRDSVPLWKAIFRSTLPAGLVGGIALLPLFHNGSVSRDSVPLWKAIFRSTLPAGLVNGILPLPLFHNGSISRDSVPLWVRASGQSKTNVKTGQRPKKADCVQNRPVSKLEGKNCDENCMAKGWRSRWQKQGRESRVEKQGGENGMVIKMGR